MIANPSRGAGRFPRQETPVRPAPNPNPSLEGRAVVPTVIHLLPESPRRGEVWRHCEICDDLAAMPPYATICDACATVATPAFGLRLVGDEGWSQ